MTPPPSGVAPAAHGSARPGPRGFSLIELAVVVAIIGILAAVAISYYRGMMDKARMTQAKTVLSHLAKAEAIYFTNFERYTDNVALLDFDPIRYPYYQVDVVLDNAGTGFTGYARGVGVMAGDLWFINTGGIPTQDNTSPFRN